MPETTSSDQHLLENIHSSPGSQWLIRKVHDRRESFRLKLERSRGDSMEDVAELRGYIQALSDVLDMPGTLQSQETEDEDE